MLGICTVMNLTYDFYCYGCEKNFPFPSSDVWVPSRESEKENQARGN